MTIDQMREPRQRTGGRAVNGKPIAPAAYSTKWLKLTPCGARGLNSKPFTPLTRRTLHFAGTDSRLAHSMPARMMAAPSLDLPTRQAALL